MATATNKIGPFNASFTGDIQLKAINAPNSYIIEGSGNSPVGFASGKAKVNLEEVKGGTKLSYEIEANVGGKIAQIGSRLIDMTAKKMADIFFGKFSELISSEKVEEKENSSTGDPKTPETKIDYGYLTAAVVLGIFLIYWMFLK